jgi:2-polyprenyl-3-methyl-5-hydroxy-6-metoxy-1,4-benzoquinol methylase
MLACLGRKLDHDFDFLEVDRILAPTRRDTRSLRVPNYEELVSDHWSIMAKKEPTLFHWTDSSIVMEHINKCVSGHSEIGWLQYACEKYLKHTSGAKHCLSLGCGSGALERQVRRMGACETIDAVDIAKGAIEEAMRLAQEENITGINYRLENIENIRLPVNRYDAVFSSSAVHHIKNLEMLFEQVRAALKRDGFFIMAEYVGPSQSQFTDKVVDIINEILQTLPSTYKKLSSDPNRTKQFFVRVTREYTNANDPSEAVRSDEIIPILASYFKILERRDYGGAILHMLLQDIIANFDHDDERDRTILKLLIQLEATLIREKALASDFCFLVAQKASDADSSRRCGF